MTIQEALQVLEQTCAMAHVPLAMHVQSKQALKVVMTELVEKENTKQENEKNDG